jgi:adenosylcobinamide-GDP ribazoletransferase
VSLLADLLTAITLLTRLPVPAFAGAVPLGRTVWAFPIVGAAVGVLAAFVYTLCHRVGMPSLLASVWAVAALVLLTGALHEDGLADTADGFGGGATRGRKLEIMRDSRLGTYGALALVILLLVRFAALTTLAAPWNVLTATVIAEGCGRAAMVVPLLLLPPARSDGLGRAAGQPPPARAAAAIVFSVLFAFALVPRALACGAIAVMFAGALVTTWIAHRQIAGHTGDVLGATSSVTEALVFSVMAAWVHHT